jgi:hypothetical protein
LAGTADIYVRVDDNSGLQDYNEAVEILTVNDSIGHTEDATTGTYSGNANTTANAILTDQSKAYTITTHNGNVDMNLKITATDLNIGVNGIAVGNQKWKLTDEYATSTPFTGAADVVKTVFGRGTDPTSAVQNIYHWLDIPALQPSGQYAGTLTYASVKS